MTRLLLLLLMIAVGSITAQTPSVIPANSKFKLLGHYATGIFDGSGAEIVAHDPGTQQVYFTNAADNAIGVLDISSPASIALVQSIDMSPYGGGVNSVAVANDILAVAVEADDKTDAGKIVLMTPQGELIKEVTVGALPDMVTFNHAGTLILSANEGEPNDDYTIDPQGTVSIIDISNGAANATATLITFEAYDDKIDLLREQGIRIFGPNASVSQDLEPEYVTVTEDDRYAFVVLQENNAMAKIDLQTYEIVDLFPLGLKDHRFDGNGLDASNRTDDINITTWPVFGMYQPDAIKAYTAGDGATYILTANEGDARDYDGYSEEARVADLTLSTTNYPNAAELQAEDQIGRLNATTASGTGSNGITEIIHIYGGRSFSIWDVNCKLIWDSGDQLAQKIAALAPDVFNSTNDDNDSRKNRSDDKGVEPEAINVMTVGDKIYALIGLERQGGIFVYDVTDPTAPTYVEYFNNRNFAADAESPAALDLGLEDIKVIQAADSPTGEQLIVTANEVSGTVSIFGMSGMTDEMEGENPVVEENPNCATPTGIRLRSNSLRTTLQWNRVSGAQGYIINLVDDKGNTIDVPVTNNKVFLSSNFAGEAIVRIKALCENGASSNYTAPIQVAFHTKSAGKFRIEAININEAIIQNDVNVFPNPVTDMINYTIELSEKSDLNVSLIDAIGRRDVIINNRQLQEGTHQFNYNINDKADGIYFLLITINGEINQQVIIKS